MNRTLGQRLATAVLAMVAVLGLGVLAATPAPAAVSSTVPVSLPNLLAKASDAPASRTIVATYHGAKGDAASPAIGTIICSITANNPFWSPPTISYQFDVVEGWGAITCTSPVAKLSIGVALDWQGAQVSTAYASSYESAAVGQTAVTDCYDGNYITVDVGVVYFPPGYTPAESEISSNSVEIPISC